MISGDGLGIDDDNDTILDEMRRNGDGDGSDGIPGFTLWRFGRIFCCTVCLFFEAKDALI